MALLLMLGAVCATLAPCLHAQHQEGFDPLSPSVLYTNGAFNVIDQQQSIDDNPHNDNSVLNNRNQPLTGASVSIAQSKLPKPRPGYDPTQESHIDVSSSSTTFEQDIRTDDQSATLPQAGAKTDRSGTTGLNPTPETQYPTSFTKLLDQLVRSQLGVSGSTKSITASTQVRPTATSLGPTIRRRRPSTLPAAADEFTHSTGRQRITGRTLTSASDLIPLIVPKDKSAFLSTKSHAKQAAAAVQRRRKQSQEQETTQREQKQQQKRNNNNNSSTVLSDSPLVGDDTPTNKRLKAQSPTRATTTSESTADRVLSSRTIQTQRQLATASGTTSTPADEETTTEPTNLPRRPAKDAKLVPGPTIPQPQFSIRPDPAFPHTILLIEYEPDTGQLYRVNFTDLSSLDGFPPASYLISSNPFRVHQLSPGHRYRFQIFSVDKDNRDITTLIHTEIQMTDPIVPNFSRDKIEVTTNSIKLAALKGRDYLQDYFVVSYTQVSPEPIKRHPPLNITDSPNSQQIEILLKRLQAGTSYNVTIQTFRIGRGSAAWSAVVTTVPNKPRNFIVRERGTEYLFISWDVPKDSGFDGYHLTWVPSDVDQEDLVEVPDVNLQSTLYNISTLQPGVRYQLQVFTLKDDRVSEPAGLGDVFTKPMSPASIRVRPDFEEEQFIATIRLPASGGYYSGCRFVLVDSGSPASSTAGVSTSPVVVDLNRTVTVTPATGSVYCEYALPNADSGGLRVQPGVAYKAYAWAASGTDAVSEPLKMQLIIAPAFNQSLFGLEFAAGYNHVSLSWPRLSFWDSLVGSNTNVTAKLTAKGGRKDGDVRRQSVIGSQGGTLEFTQLRSGVCYEWEIFTSTNGYASDAKALVSQRTDTPNMKVYASSVSSTSASLLIEAGAPNVSFSRACRINVYVQNSNEEEVSNDTLPIIDSGLLPGLMIKNLKPFKIYVPGGLMTCGNGPREPANECPTLRRRLVGDPFQTAEDIPGPIKNISVRATMPFRALLEWSPPVSARGELVGYQIAVIPEVRSGEPAWNITIPSAASSFYNVNNLTGGFEYAFSARARTAAGYGPPSALRNIRMPVLAPPTPRGHPQILEGTVREQDFSISFSLSDHFSTENGLILKYAVIVAESQGLKFTNGDVKDGTNWTRIKDMDIWPPYIAIMKTLHPSKHLDQGPTNLFIGMDPNCIRTSNGYCNGPLRPGRKYQVKIRAYTAQDKYSDTQYSNVVKTVAKASPATTAIIVIVVMLTLAFLVLIGGVVFFRSRGVDPITWCKGKMGTNPEGGGQFETRSFTDGATRAPNGPNSQLPLNRSERGHQLLALPTIVPGYTMERNRPVHRKRFGEHVRLMCADSDFRFSEEYEDLKQVGRGQPTAAADLHCNRVKNRFTNILPYDHSRVKLVPVVDDEEGSDYINANYIAGFNSPREFIAAQGPLPGTLDDFWRMVWETNCRCVVNLTRCIEKGREKCHQYWPEGKEPVTYGDYEVSLMNDSRHAEWTHREFRVTCLSTNDQPRTVRQCHYTAWPDFGVPENPQSLIEFVRAFRKKTPPNSPPVVVHCSAGVGRSGTFITVDRLIQHLDTNELIDIFGIVHEMRQDRVQMVQTEQQYICIHQCILKVVEEAAAAEDYHNAMMHNNNGDMSTQGPTPPTVPSVPTSANSSSAASSQSNSVSNSPSLNGSANHHHHHHRHHQYNPQPQQHHGHQRQPGAPQQYHQNPTFEDDEGIVESGV